VSQVILRLKGQPPVPMEADCLTPDAIDGLSLESIERLIVWVGNRQEPLGEYFSVAVEAADGEPFVRIVGDCSRVKWIGKGMTRGRLEVQGPAGMHLGAYQSGGVIDCLGDAGDWAGAMLSGGLLRIRGRAGHLVGAGYRGEPFGMTGGMILVHGDAGNEVGARLGRGVIAVLGSVGDLAGLGMHAGTILCGGDLGIRPGADMDRGSIIALGQVELLPTFRYCCTFVPPYLALLGRKLLVLGAAPAAFGWDGGLYRLYAGDLVRRGQGEVLVWERPSA
jgi:formylmethanofuran dehydrogenase subunit C